jgi:hypothetical protein
VLGLIRRYLQSGIMVGGLGEQRVEGPPQGGPSSPLLSNILLDDLDKELERRGPRFCRYADDGNGYVKSARAGERVRATLKRFLTSKLRLKVNEAQSPVTRPWEAKLLGPGMTVHRQPRLKVAARSGSREPRRGAAPVMGAARGGTPAPRTCMLPTPPPRSSGWDGSACWRPSKPMPEHPRHIPTAAIRNRTSGGVGGRRA